VASFLNEWDVAVMDDEEDQESPMMKLRQQPPHRQNNNNNTSYPRLALERAAQAGHPLAQHYLANAHASGIWPVGRDDDDNDDSTKHNKRQSRQQLHVLDEWLPTNHEDHPQVTKSFLLWHMAAMAGNIEAAMALAYRLTGEGATEQQPSSGKIGSANSCMDVLPYYEAAANGIMDQLEGSLHSRAKVIPHMDKHVLAQVHMHGGTSSQLDWNNKPDESKEALQFYHLKATTTPWAKKKSSSTTTTGSTSSSDSTIDVHAAYTLGHLYHHGVRGVQQNLTLSLQYYEIAASNGHWESAGHAGTFYFWGMGVDANPKEAMTYFRLGAPLGMEGCRRKHDQAQKVQQQQQNNGGEDSSLDDDIDETTIVECDDQSLNGLGLIYLFGIEGTLEVGLTQAEKYFTLAKEMGNTDALYNLAMMWLGWKTHFKKVEDLTDDGVSHSDTSDLGFGAGAGAGGSSIVIAGTATATTATGTGAAITTTGAATGGGPHKPPPNYALHISKTKHGEPYFKGPNQSDMQDALKLLTIAANKGHVQAKHRLAMIYSEGIKVQTTALKYDAIKKDCLKARSQYEWIVSNASPLRSKRLRSAYRDYISRNFEPSLRNYLAAAETGSIVAQVNAAFLLERGTCLGLAPADCAKASVRLWKAAAARGNAEACLRVGDFYYYGRLRDNELPVGPLGWVQYVLYPENYLPKVFKKWRSQWNAYMYMYIGGGGELVVENTEPSSDSSSSKKEEEQTCDADDCHRHGGDHDDHDVEEERTQEQEIVTADLAMAGHYYQVAAEKHHSPRANFNLGFMHEWGLGLKQDFPLAKRHYDLATSGHSSEAELAVQIALMAMSSHEYVVKWQLSSWWNSNSNNPNTAIPSKKSTNNKDDDGDDNGVPKPRPADPKVGQPVPATAAKNEAETTPMDVILAHIFDWSSLVILVLLYVLGQLMALRLRQRRR
jgi:TPR repeat protein